MRSDPAASHNPTHRQRLLSVDALRGLMVGFMILANNPGNTTCVYNNLIHSRWHGWSLVDFVFPIFLFLVGVSIALTVCVADRSRENPRLWPKALKRAALLFALGLFVNGFPYFQLDSLRIPGVLQRIAVVYLATLWLHMHLGRKGVLAVIAGILVGYWLLWMYVPVPGLGFPTLDYEYNLESWLDQMLMRGHLWEYDTSWDPEGILSTIPCVALALLGVLSGTWLRGEKKGGAGQVFLVGLLLHLGGIAWNAYFPINKIITTSSFVLFAGGVAIMLLALSHQVIDRWRLSAGALPLTALGRNALFAYVVSEVFGDVLYMIKLPGMNAGRISLHNWLFGALSRVVEDCFTASLVWAGGFLLLLVALAVLMDRRGLYVRL